MRTDKIASVIHHAVQRVITRGLNDPRVRGLVSVTKVEVTPDLAEARVHVSVLPAEYAELSLHGLRSAQGHIQAQIASDVTARRMPRLRFELDDSLKRQAAVDSAIAQAVAASSNDHAGADAGPEER